MAPVWERDLTALAEIYHTPLIPHTGPGSVYANMHVMSAANTPNHPTPYMEFIDDPPVFPASHFYQLVQEEDRPQVDAEGYISLKPKPGLGFDWDLQATKRLKVVGEIH